jgi:4-amino-4-deoxy-L-arabinose transferase-like glycosyltransferase
MYNRRCLILSLLLLSFVFVASAFINLTDPTEARNATIGRDMAINGNFITPMIWSSGRHVPYLGKPPLHFWMIAASVNIFGENEFAVRFPSFLSAFFLLILIQ